MASRTNIDWQRVPDLGKVSDSVVAERLGVSTTTVSMARRVLRIPSYRPNNEMFYRDWTKVENLGKVPDAEVAAEIGESIGMVVMARRILGIPSPVRGRRPAVVESPPPIPIQVDTAALVDQIMDGIRPSIEKALRDSIEHLAAEETVEPSKGIDWDNEPDLGKIPDAELARRLKVHPLTVGHARRKRGIPKANRGYAEGDYPLTMGLIPIKALRWEDEAYPLPDFSKVQPSNGWDSLRGGSLEGVEAIQSEWLEAGLKVIDGFTIDDDYAELDLSDLRAQQIRSHRRRRAPARQIQGEWSRWKFEPEMAGQHYPKKRLPFGISLGGSWSPGPAENTEEND